MAEHASSAKLDGKIAASAKEKRRERERERERETRACFRVSTVSTCDAHSNRVVESGCAEAATHGTRVADNLPACTAVVPPAVPLEVAAAEEAARGGFVLHPVGHVVGRRPLPRRRRRRRRPEQEGHVHVGHQDVAQVRRRDEAPAALAAHRLLAEQVPAQHLVLALGPAVAAHRRRRCDAERRGVSGARRSPGRAAAEAPERGFVDEHVFVLDEDADDGLDLLLHAAVHAEQDEREQQVDVLSAHSLVQGGEVCLQRVHLDFLHKEKEVAARHNRLDVRALLQVLTRVVRERRHQVLEEGRRRQLRADVHPALPARLLRHPAHLLHRKQVAAAQLGHVLEREHLLGSDVTRGELLKRHGFVQVHRHAVRVVVAATGGGAFVAVLGGVALRVERALGTHLHHHRTDVLQVLRPVQLVAQQVLQPPRHASLHGLEDGAGHPPPRRLRRGLRVR
eukprot:Rhum_TRINITY_DN2770_c0_g4::Rhum_TRINITY_DN2770_c0_g4_i1::g.8273::m.8273